MRYLSFIKKYSGYFNSVKWGSYAILISFLRQVCLVPFFLTALGNQAYSFWLVLNTIAILIGALSLGHLHYSSNYLNLVYHQQAGMEDEFKQVSGSNYAYLLLQLLLVAGMCLLPVISFFSGFAQSYIVHNNGVSAFLLLFFGRYLSQYAGLFILRLLEPLGLIKKTLKYQTLLELADFVCTLAAITATQSILYTSVAVFLCNTLCVLVLALYVARRLPYKVTFFSMGGWHESMLFLRSSFFMNGSFVVEKIYDSGINLIVVAFFNTAALPVFYTTRVISNVFYRFSLTLILPLFPEVQKKYALKDYDGVLSVMQKFWAVSGMVLTLAMTVGIPLVPYIYMLWTKNTLQFDARLMCYLFLGVLFQNFATIVYEFYKKTNLSWQMLLVNIMHVVIMVVFMAFFGRQEYLPGLGISFFIAEALCACFGFYLLSGIFKNHKVLRIIRPYFIPVLIFSISLGIYIAYLNYFILLGGALLAIATGADNVKTVLNKL